MEIVNGNILIKFHISNFTNGLNDTSRSNRPLGFINWLYNTTIETGYCRNCHKNVGKRHRNVKITSHYHSSHLLLYKRAEHLSSGLGRFLECWKCNILVITQALVLCLIYTHSSLCYNLYI